MVRDILSGSGSSSPAELIALGKEVVFRADDGKNGSELWKSDGSTAGTVLLKDIRPGTTGSFPDSLAAVGSRRVVFTADHGAKGRELWLSDGTATGTTMVADVWPGPSASVALSTSLTMSRGNLLFAAHDGTKGLELWKLAGTGYPAKPR